MDRKGQLFTLDLFLALVPLTLVLAYSASAMSGLANQIQSYAYTYDAQRVTMDAADLLLKSPGEPVGWDNQTAGTIGFASVENNFVYNHILNLTKLTYFKNANTSPAIQAALWNVTHGRNILVNISASDPDYSMRIMGYTDPNTSTWTVTTDDDIMDTELESAGNLFVVERITRILTELGVAPERVWDYQGQGEILTAPTVVDQDCDGEKEVITGTNSDGGGVWVFEANGTLKWWYPSGLAYTSSPLAVDLDGDCGLEIVIGETENGKGATTCPGEPGGSAGAFKGCPSNITAIDDDGTLLWYYKLDDEIWASPLVADIDYDGINEVVISNMYDNASIYAFYGNNGTLKWRFFTCDLTNGPAGCSSSDRQRYKGGQAIMGNIDGNTANGMEIAAGNDLGVWHVIHGDGTEYWSAYPVDQHIHATAATADITGNGINDFIGPGKNGLYLYYHNGTLITTIASAATDTSAPAIADLNNDEEPEIVLGTKTGVRAYYKDGTEMWVYASGTEVKSSPAIADINDDCVLDVVIGVGTNLVALDGATGDEIFSEDTGAAFNEGSPTVADVDGDGIQEILAPSGNNMTVYDVNGYGDAWPTFHQAEASMTSYSVWRTGEWTGSICGLISGAYSTIETRARITADVKIYVW